MGTRSDRRVQNIPIDAIDVVSPRAHEPAKLQELAASIARDGLHRPITVRPGGGSGRLKRYGLVSGSRRLAAYQRLGEQKIPALLVEGSDAELALMRLAENLGRHDAVEVARYREVAGWGRRGQSVEGIARKTGLATRRVAELVRLARCRQSSLRKAVDEEQLDLVDALALVGASGVEVRDACRRARAEEQESSGQAAEPAGSGYRRWDFSAKSVSRERLLAEAREEGDRLKTLLAKSAEAERRLALLRQAVERLFDDPNFVALLEAEGCTSLPAVLCLPELVEE